MAYRLTVANEKGGVGKTTIAINVAGALADRGHDVLFVDLDAQGNGTIGLGFDASYTGDGMSLYDVLVDLDSQQQIDTVIQSHVEFVDGLAADHQRDCRHDDQCLDDVRFRRIDLVDSELNLTAPYSTLFASHREVKGDGL